MQFLIYFAVGGLFLLSVLFFASTTQKGPAADAQDGSSCARNDDVCRLFFAERDRRAEASRPYSTQSPATKPAPAPKMTESAPETAAPAPDVTPEPVLAAVAATPAPAPDVTPEPVLAAVAATPAPAPDVTSEPKLDAAPKAQLAPEVLPKVKPAAGPARAQAPPKKKRIIATGPTGAAGATTGREPTRPRDRDFGQAAGESPPQ
jgi:hypothetical protein